MSLEQGSRDTPMTKPTRKGSTSSSEGSTSSSEPQTLLKAQHQLLLSSSKKFSSNVLCSPPEASLEGCAEGFVRNSSSSLYLSAEEFVGSSDFNLDSLEESAAEDEERTVVRFAALPAKETIKVMGLDDYTREEVEACWYSRDDIQRFRRQADHSNLNKALLCPPFNRGSTRWST